MLSTILSVISQLVLHDEFLLGFEVVAWADNISLSFNLHLKQKQQPVTEESPKDYSR